MTTALLTVTITWLLRLWKTDFIRNKVFAKIGCLPRPLQWIAPVVLGLLAAGGQGFVSGLRGTELIETTLQSGGELGLMAIGLWHAVKRLPISGVIPKPTVACAEIKPIELPIQLVPPSSPPPAA